MNLGAVVPLSTASAATLDKGGVSLAKASNGISLAVWADNRTGSYDVYGSLLSASGTRISPLGGFPIVTNPGRHEGEPQVAACGNTFLVVYGGEFNAFEISTVRDLYARRVDTTGNVLDLAELVIAADPMLLEHNVRGPTSDGLDTFLVAYRTSEFSIYGSIKAMRISASSGAMLDAPSGIELARGVDLTLRKNPSASYGDGRFLVTWDDGVDGCRYSGEQGCIDIYGAFLASGSGLPIGLPFPTTTAFSCQEGSWSGFDGTNFVVSHSDERINNCYTASGRRRARPRRSRDGNDWFDLHRVRSCRIAEQRPERRRRDRGPVRDGDRLPRLRPGWANALVPAEAHRHQRCAGIRADAQPPRPAGRLGSAQRERRSARARRRDRSAQVPARLRAG
jgi:hypothetical protein